MVKQIEPNAAEDELGKLLGMRQFKVERVAGDMLYFRNGVYNRTTGKAEYTIEELPYLLDKMTHLHKARSADPLFFFNVFFAFSLFFFVISSFWMFTPKTSVFKKGIYFSLCGIALTLALLLT